MERPVIVASVVCPACGSPATAVDPRCLTCGAILKPLSQTGPVARSVIDSRWQLLLLLFGAMGVLGIPLLWSSRAFGIIGKLVFSLLVTLWTALLLGLCWWSLTWSAGRLGIEF